MNDQEYDAIVAYKQNGTLPALSRTGQYYFRKRAEGVTLTNGELYIQKRNPLTTNVDSLLVVPQRNVKSVLERLYDDPLTTKNGIHRFYNWIATKYVGITRTHVMEFLARPRAYQLHRQAPARLVINKPIITHRPNERWQCDLIDMRSNADTQKKWLLTVINCFSKYVWVVPLSAKSEQKVVKAFEAIFQFEKPLILQSDNGAEFKNDGMTRLCGDRGIQQIFGAPYKPSTNGQVENFNRTVKRAIAAYQTHNRVRSWLEIIDDIVDNYNDTPHSFTDFKPNELHNTANNRVVKSLANKIKRRAIALTKTPEITPEIAVGTLVRILRRLEEGGKTGVFAKKYKCQWSVAVYKVMSISRPRRGSKPLYTVVSSQGNEQRRYRNELLAVVKTDRRQVALPPDQPDDDNDEQPQPRYVAMPVEPPNLRPRNDQHVVALPPPPPLPGEEERPLARRRAPQRRVLPAPDDRLPEPVPVLAGLLAQEYFPEKIIGERRDGNRILYRVRWSSYDESGDTWEPRANLIDKKKKPVVALAEYLAAKKVATAV